MGRSIETINNTVLDFLATQNGYDLWSEKNQAGECTGFRLSTLIASTDDEVRSAYLSAH